MSDDAGVGEKHKPRRKRRLLTARQGEGPLVRYSRFVGWMQIVLPSLAAVLLALVLAWPKLMQDDDRFQIGFAKLSPKEVETLSMVNSRYFGVDQANRPFAVSADLAVQQPGDADLVALTAPKADFTNSSGANVFVDADTGLYHQQSKILDLAGTVNLFHDTGYELHTTAATIDLVHNSARGTEPITGHGPQGRTLAAEGFEVRDRGLEVVFTGKATMTMAAAGKGATAASKGAAGPSRGATRR